MASCSSSFHDYLVSCPEGIKVNIISEVGPYSALRWQITDKFDNQYEGDVLTNINSGFIIPVDQLPAGLFTAYSGSFSLKVLDIDNQCKPVSIMVAGYYDEIVFDIKKGNRVKDFLGCEISCESSGGSNLEHHETHFGDGTKTVFETQLPFIAGTEEVHVFGILYGVYDYSVTGISEITLNEAPEPGVEIRINY